MGSSVDAARRVRLPSRLRNPAGEQAADPISSRWLIVVWLVVALFAAVTAVRSEVVDIPLRDPGGRMFQGRLTSALVLFGVLVVVDAAVRSLRAGSGVRGILPVLRTRWLGARLAVAVSGLLAYHVVYICYRNLKSWDAFNTVRDQQLLDFETWLFFGHSPASLLHDALGEGAAAYVLAFIYRSFTYLVPTSVVASLVFLDRIRDSYVFLTAAMWVWILGVGSYYLIPSLGPFASAPADFSGLPNTAITSTQVEYLVERAYLLANPAAGDAFASISAFASLHVGFTCMVLMMLLYYGRVWAAKLLGVYLAGTMLATVYFGWHFVVDDVAGVLLAYLAVLLARLMIYPGSRRAPWRLVDGVSRDRATGPVSEPVSGPGKP
jgi:hypothetical protein